MVPAQEGFSTLHRGAGKLDDGLIKDAKLALF